MPKFMTFLCNSDCVLTSWWWSASKIVHNTGERAQRNGRWFALFTHSISHTWSANSLNLFYFPSQVQQRQPPHPLHGQLSQVLPLLTSWLLAWMERPSPVTGFRPSLNLVFPTSWCHAWNCMRTTCRRAASMACGACLMLSALLTVSGNREKSVLLDVGISL